MYYDFQVMYERLMGGWKIQNALLLKVLGKSVGGYNAKVLSYEVKW